MAYIELRNDGWFEKGKDDEKMWPAAYHCYLAKQEIKRALEAINNMEGVKAASLDGLEKLLANLPGVGEAEFHPPPYLEGSKIFIDTFGPPGKAYLGEVVEESREGAI